MQDERDTGERAGQPIVGQPVLAGTHSNRHERMCAGVESGFDYAE